MKKCKFTASNAYSRITCSYHYQNRSRLAFLFAMRPIYKHHVTLNIVCLLWKFIFNICGVLSQTATIPNWSSQAAL